MTGVRDCRPLIGVTKPDRGDLPSFWATVLALRLCGARVISVTARAPGVALSLDGLLLSGGRDVHPSRFETAPKAGYRYDDDREAMELDWLARARSADLPTLAICRGAQLMNVAAGGALHMNVADTFRAARYPSHWLEQLWFRKTAEVAPGSRLAGIVGPGDLRINSFHSQAVERLGGGLRVSAREIDGAVQAIEDPTRRFWLGVQFHPEFLLHHRRARALFEAFVSAARRFHTERGAV
jgi:putative glutamine amidotransferase